MLDSDNKGYITASDIEKLGNEVDGENEISTSEANEMTDTTNKIFGEGINVQEHRLQSSVFKQLFEPSSH